MRAYSTVTGELINCLTTNKGVSRPRSTCAFTHDSLFIRLKRIGFSFLGNPNFTHNTGSLSVTHHRELPLQLSPVMNHDQQSFLCAILLGQWHLGLYLVRRVISSSLILHACGDGNGTFVFTTD